MIFNQDFSFFFIQLYGSSWHPESMPTLGCRYNICLPTGIVNPGPGHCQSGARPLSIRGPAIVAVDLPEDEVRSLMTKLPTIISYEVFSVCIWSDRRTVPASGRAILWRASEYPARRRLWHSAAPIIYWLVRWAELSARVKTSPAECRTDIHSCSLLANNSSGRK